MRAFPSAFGGSKVPTTGLSLPLTTISPFQSISAEKTMQPKFSTSQNKEV